MALCKECGAELNELFPFCVACGAKISESVAKETETLESVDNVDAPDMATKTFDAATEETESIPQESAPEGDKTDDAPANGTEAADEDVTIFVPEKKTDAPDRNVAFDRPPEKNKDEKADAPNGSDPQLPLGKQKYRGKPDKKGEYGVVGTPYYFLMSLLYLIPIVGLIMTVVMSFGGTVNQNKSHFARCVLIYKIIVILALFAGIILAIFFKEDVLAFYGALFNREFVEWRDLFGTFKSI